MSDSDLIEVLDDVAGSVRLAGNNLTEMMDHCSYKLGEAIRESSNTEISDGLYAISVSLDNIAKALNRIGNALG